MSITKLKKWITKNEDAFINAVASRHKQRLLLSLHSTTGCQLYIYIKYREVNPNKGDELLMIIRSFADFGTADSLFRAFSNPTGWAKDHRYEDCIEAIEEIHEEYWPRIKELIKTPKEIKKPSSGNMKVRKTQILNELMLRGFVIPGDVRVEEFHEGYSLFVKVPVRKGWEDIKLLWSKPFDTDKSARKHAKRFAIGEYEIS